MGNPGEFNVQNNQPGQQGAAYVAPKDQPFITQQRQRMGLSVAPAPAPAPQPVQQPQQTTQPVSTPGTDGLGITDTLFKQPTIEPTKLYEGLYAKSGIRDIEAGLSEKTNQYNEQVAKIKDNPYLSEATMTGRIKKLDDKFRADTANIQNDIAMRKADVEMRLNLELKKFDIDSEQTRQSWSQLNSLISAGALANASGEDIASITRATGIPGSFLISIANKQKKEQEPKLTIDKVDDGTNIYAVALDSQGNVVNKTILAASKPEKKTGGITPYQQTQQDIAKQASFERAIQDGIDQLQKGRPWGEVWNRIHALFPEVPNELIDTLLGTYWRDAGAYERS